MGLFRSEKQLIKSAASTRPWPRNRMKDNAEDTLLACKNYFALNCIKVSVKHRSAPNSHTTTAYPKHLRLAWNWESYTPVSKAVTKIHEVTHYNDRKHVHRWWSKYTTSPWNLVIFECRAYFAGMLAESEMRGHICTYENHKNEVDDLVDVFRRTYFPTRMLNKAKLRRVIHRAAKGALG